MKEEIEIKVTWKLAWGLWWRVWVICLPIYILGYAGIWLFMIME